MIGCFVAVLAIVIGLSLLSVVGIFLTNFFTSFSIVKQGGGLDDNTTVLTQPFVFGTQWTLLEGIIGLLGFAFLILIAYAAIKSFKGG